MIAALLNPKAPNFATQSRDMQAAAHAIGQQIHLLSASNEDEIDAALAALAHEGVVALAVGADPFLAKPKRTTRRARGIEWRELAAAGGLISYGISITGAYREAGRYVGSILKGEKPADLPVLQPAKFELVINLKTAKALGLNVMDRILALADEVIE
jgi:putative ABC transport system substrate-binding protein